MATVKTAVLGLQAALAGTLFLGVPDAGALAQDEKPRVNIRLGADGADVEVIKKKADETRRDQEKDADNPKDLKVVTTDPEEVKSVTDAVKEPMVFPAPDPLEGLIPLPEVLQDAKAAYLSILFFGVPQDPSSCKLQVTVIFFLPFTRTLFTPQRRQKLLTLLNMRK